MTETGSPPRTGNAPSRTGTGPSSSAPASAGSPLLAVATASLTKASETFIRDHIRTISPGRTVVMCEDADEAHDLGYTAIGGLPFAMPRGQGIGQAAALMSYARDQLANGMPAEAEDRVVAFLRETGVKAILAEYLNVGSRFVRAARVAGVPLYVHAHGFDASQLPRHWRWRVRFRGLFREAAGVIAPSRFLGNHLVGLGCPPEKIHVSPCGVDPEKFRPSTREPGRILAVGWLREKKAPHLTVAAFARILKRHPSAELHVVGGGPLMQRCRDMASDTGCKHAVHFHGSKPSEFVAEQMRKAALFVQHSVVGPEGDTEGLPVAVLEAMASEVPVVSTRHAGIPEAVIEGETGLLVEERDVEGMADAMAAILSDPERGAAMGAAGRTRVLEHFTSAHTQGRLRQIMGLPA